MTLIKVKEDSNMRMPDYALIDEKKETIIFWQSDNTGKLLMAVYEDQRGKMGLVDLDRQPVIWKGSVKKISGPLC